MSKSEDVKQAVNVVCSMLSFFGISYLNATSIINAKHNRVSDQTVRWKETILTERF
jgi:hypothetical protein